MKIRTTLCILSALSIAATTSACDDNASPVCGNGILESGEVCDIKAGVPQTCAEYNPSKAWISGSPLCALDCKSVLQGTCTDSPLVKQPVCGDGIVDTGEVCDGAAGVPATCSEFNSSISWKAGGAPACALDCRSLQLGTCEPEQPAAAVCGNGIKEAGEICDKQDGVPATCTAFDPSKTWQAGGKPACETDCKSIAKGSCIEAARTNPDPDDPNATDADTPSTTTCNTTAADALHESCNGQIAHFCSDKGFVTDRDCAKLTKPENPLTCQVSKENNYADCVKSCNPATFIKGSSCIGKYISYHYCELTESGGHYEFVYTEDEPCKIACENGRCVTSTGPQVGAACTPETFKNQCSGGNIYECINGKIAKTECQNGTTCAVQFGHDNPVCTTRCSLNDVSTYGCQQINGKNALKNHICVMSADSKMYWFDENDVCANSCDNGVCDAKIPTPGSPCDPSTDDLCAHNTVYYCRTDTKKIDTMECGRGDYIGSQLCRYLNKGYADCVHPCSEGTEALMQCGGNNDKGTGYTMNFICEKATDGLFYTFYHEDSCPNGCKDGICQ